MTKNQSNEKLPLGDCPKVHVNLDLKYRVKAIPELEENLPKNLAYNLAEWLPWWDKISNDENVDSWWIDIREGCELSIKHAWLGKDITDDQYFYLNLRYIWKEPIDLNQSYDIAKFLENE